MLHTHIQWSEREREREIGLCAECGIQITYMLRTPLRIVFGTF